MPKKNKEVVTIDIPGAFLHADNDDYVIMKMNGLLAELMVKTDPFFFSQTRYNQKREAGPAIFTPAESLVRHDEKRLTIL